MATAMASFFLWVTALRWASWQYRPAVAAFALAIFSSLSFRSAWSAKIVFACFRSRFVLAFGGRSLSL